MLPKFSIVSIGVHGEALEWAKRYKPVSFLIVNERGQSSPQKPWTNREIDLIRDAMSASPRTLWIMRSWPDGIGENVPGWPLWDRLIECFKPFRKMSNPLMAHGYNEPGGPWIFTERGAVALANIEIKFAQRIHDAGLLYGGLCFPESHLGKNHQHLWKQLAPVLAYLDAWIPNEYDWPNVFTSRDQGYKWRIGHWEHQLLAIGRFLPYDKIPPVIIGEGILDGKIEYPHPHGWQRLLSGKGYALMHQAAYDDTYHKAGVFAHHTFCYCHRSSEWNSYSVKPILYQLGQLVQNQVYWEDYKGGGSMNVWKNVPENIARWRPIIEKVTSSFHVPIPDYNGIHLSPAKVITCVIDIESDGEARAVNPESGAAGLCQIMPFHFQPGQDPYEPEWNIRKGLSILKEKIDKAGKIQRALFFYSGKANRPWEPFISGYWADFVFHYKQFWGVDLEPESVSPEVERLKVALADCRARTKAAIKTLSGEE